MDAEYLKQCIRTASKLDSSGACEQADAIDEMIRLAAGAAIAPNPNWWIQEQQRLRGAFDEGEKWLEKARDIRGNTPAKFLPKAPAPTPAATPTTPSLYEDASEIGKQIGKDKGFSNGQIQKALDPKVENVLKQPGVRNKITQVLQKFLPKLEQIAAKKGAQVAIQEIIAESSPEIAATVPEIAATVPEVVAGGAAGLTVGAVLLPVLITLLGVAGLGTLAYYATQIHNNYGIDSQEHKGNEYQNSLNKNMINTQLSTHYLSQLANAVRQGQPFQTTHDQYLQQLKANGGTQQDIAAFEAGAPRLSDPNYANNHPMSGYSGEYALPPTATPDTTQQAYQQPPQPAYDPSAQYQAPQYPTMPTGDYPTMSPAPAYPNYNAQPAYNAQQYEYKPSSQTASLTPEQQRSLYYYNNVAQNYGGKEGLLQHMRSVGATGDAQLVQNYMA